MDRRSFLKLFGYGLGAAVVVPKLALASGSLSELKFPNKAIVPPDVWYAPAGLQHGKLNYTNVEINEFIKTAFEEAINLHKLEVNDDITRAGIANRVSNQLKLLSNLRIIYQYNVICDLSCNTASTIDNGDVVMVVGYKTVKGFTETRLKLVATSKSVSFNTI